MEILINRDSKPISRLKVAPEEILEGAEFYIGRSEDCHIVLNDQLISRHHAVIKKDADKYRLKKLSDIGRLLVNGVEVVETTLNKGDQIVIGSYNLLVENMPLLHAKTTDEFTTIMSESMIIGAPKPIEPIQLAPMAIEQDLELKNEDSPSQLFENEIEEKNIVESATSESIVEEITVPETEENNFENQSTFTDGEGFSAGEETVQDNDSKTQVYSNFANYYLVLSGAGAPFDKYKIEAKETVIGRDKNNSQIYIPSELVSSKHAIIKKTLVNCIIEDLGSANGTKVNGERINKHELLNGDVIEVGPVKIKVIISSDLLDSESGKLMPVDLDQEVEVEEVQEEVVSFDELNKDAPKETENKSILSKLKDPKKRKIAIYAAVGVLVLFLLLGDEEETAVEETKDNKPETQVQVNPENKVEAKKEFPPEVLEKLAENYQVAIAKFKDGSYAEALTYLEQIKAIDPTYKDTASLLIQVKEGLEQLDRLRKEQEAEKERQLRAARVAELLQKAKTAVDEKSVSVAETYFAQILKEDPENLEVQQLKMVIEAFKEEEKRKKEEEEAKIAKRKAQESALRPGETLYLREDWYKAILELEKFLQLKNLDSDLLTKATDMLKDARAKKDGLVFPLLGKARSFKEAEDLKQAYETYGEVLRFDPTHEEALNERTEIKLTLDERAKKLFREALISESLSLFEEAQDKLKEVQQIAPINSEYYLKATEKLKNYLE